jgi:hypothetical protein
MKFRAILGALFLCVLVGLPVAAQETIPVHSLSGPPSEFASRRLPTAAETAVPTSILLLDRGVPAPATAAVAPGTTTSTFSASPGVGFSLVQVTTQYPVFSPATLTAPDGSRFEFDGVTIRCYGGPCDEYTAEIEMSAFVNQAPGGVAVFSISGGEVRGGTWTSAIAPPGGGALPLATAQVQSLITFDDNVVQVEVEPDPCLAAVNPCLAGQTGQAFGLVDGVAPVLRIGPVSDPSEGRAEARDFQLTSLRVTVAEAFTGRVVGVESLEPGRVAALPRGADGATLVSLPRLSAGTYGVRLDLEGELAGSGPIERTGYYPLRIEPRRYQLSGEVETAVIDKDRLRLELGLAPFAGEPKHVAAYAEVWSRDGKTPVAWIGGMTAPERDDAGRSILPLVLDARWLALAEKAGTDLALRNLRLQDPDSFVPIVQVAELPFSVRELPESAFLEPREVIQDDTLFTGKDDVTIPARGPASPPDLLGVNVTGILLVHGFCAGNTWPFADFNRGRIGGTEIFSDFGASRSHDNFAQRIRTTGDAMFSSSFSVVAHSQGGAATTHLRTFYPSRLDVASTAPRRIQTMGTPYGGSTLMDIYLGLTIAAGPIVMLVAEAFGSCAPPQFDLSTPGSLLWQTGIPSSVRSQVFYHRTRHTRPGNFWQALRFWRWRCNFASFLIPGPDDGVVAEFQGLFSGANNQGVTTGECHTGGMHHPSQTANAARNDDLDRLGRPVPAALVARCVKIATWYPGGPTGNGYYGYTVSAASSTPGNFPIATFTWINGGVQSIPTTSNTYGPLYPGLPGQAQNYLITVIVTDTSGASSGASCSVP